MIKAPRDPPKPVTCKAAFYAGIVSMNGFRLKGQAIFKEGDPVLGMYFVYTGIVKVHKQWGQEKELILRFATAGDIFGHRGLGGTGSELLYPISASAVEPVTACFIPLSFFQTTLRMNDRFTEQLLYFYVSELQESAG